MNLTKPAISPGNACYQRSSAGSIFAVSFVFPDKSRILAPYAYLAPLKMTSAGNLLFRYSFGDIEVIGENLEGIYDAVSKHELVEVTCADPTRIEPSGTRVRDMTFSEPEGD